MRAWKLFTLLLLAGAVPYGMAQEQLIERWRDWLRSVPFAADAGSPALQTYPYNSNNSGTSSKGSNESNSSQGSSSLDSSSSNYGSGTSSGSGSGSAWTSTPSNSSNQGSNSTGTGGSYGRSGNAQSGSSNGNSSASNSNSWNGSNSAGRSNSGSGSSSENKNTGGFTSDSRSGAAAPTGSGKPEEFDGVVEGPPFQELHDVFRFDLHPKQILARWPRVTTVLAEPALEGLRVPLVTGKDPDDLSGSLTYYFDHQKVVQRITFQGYTGEEHRLIELAVQGIGMKPMPTLGAGLYMLSWNGKPRSVLRLTFAPVVRASDPLRRIEVMLEINRPRAYYSLSKEFQDVLDHDRANARF